MSATKDYIMDIQEAELADDCFISDNAIFKYQTNSQPVLPATNPEVIRFFADVVPDHNNKKYYLMLTQGKCYNNLAYRSLYDLTSAASTFSADDYNVYFSPAVYSGWRSDATADYVKSLFVDIDDIVEDTASMSTQELCDWLMTTYRIPESLLPNWIVCSGHGLHLYYLIDELDLTNIDNYLLRKQYIRRLICFFRSDIVCQNVSHILRVPLSYNLKGRKIKTRLHHTNTSSNHSLKRLDYFTADDRQIEEYFITANQIKAEKCKATMQENGTHAGRKKSTDTASKKSSASRAGSYAVDWYSPDYDLCIEYKQEYRTHARAWNIFLDLYNYAVRRKGWLTGYRHTLAYIMAVYAKRCIADIGTAKELILPCFSSDFRDEAETAIDSIYQSDKIYRFRNTTIAIYLNFTDSDYKYSYCNYTEAQAQASRKKCNKRSRAKQLRKEQSNKKSEKDFQIAYITANMESISNKQLADDLGISESTVHRIKRKIRANH